MASICILDGVLYPQDFPYFVALLRSPILGELITEVVPSSLQVRIVLRYSYFDPSLIQPTAADIAAAAQRLAGVAVRTPLVSAPVLDERLGARVFLKAETLQRTGSFKFRGAYNKISQIPPERRAAGVVAYSSGNHAQGVAAAAKLLGIRATIVMPSDAPRLKRARTEALGAEVVAYDRNSEDRAAIAAKIVAERGATLVPPYDDPLIIAGQGTIGTRDRRGSRPRSGSKPEIVVIGASGGGLAAGVSLGVKARVPAAKFYTVEPEGFDDTARSFKSGKREANPRLSGSICDALMSNTPGELTFPITAGADRRRAGGVRCRGRARGALRFRGAQTRGRAGRRHRPRRAARRQARRARQGGGRRIVGRQYRCRIVCQDYRRIASAAALTKTEPAARRAQRHQGGERIGRR